ncbi:uncharacterized protein LOC143292949 [Babylonia areolata]|uniref:uncharacterized protein LOC143292949 n=1 Tax=Babylonia areolata TaxID=304850 RepID=UPI003FCF73F8
MASMRFLCCVLVSVLLYGHIAGHDQARPKRHAADDNDDDDDDTNDNPHLPLLQHLQEWTHRSIPGQDVQSRAVDMQRVMDRVGQALAPPGTPGRGLDSGSLMRLVNSVRQTGKDRIEFQLTDGDPNDPNSPEVSVVVETLSAEDLLASDEGRQQLSQLNAQLEQAVNSLSQGVEVMQGPDQVGGTVGNLLNASAEAMLGGLVDMLASADDGRMFLGVVGSQALQAIHQLTATLDQLPGLKGLLGKVYRLVEHLLASSQSSTKDMQQLFSNAAMLFHGMRGGQGGVMMMDVDSMLEMALNGLNANLELLELVVNEMHHTADSPSFLLALNDTRCLVKSLRGDLSIDTAAGCLQHLMQAIAMVNQSEHMVTNLIDSLIHFLDNPSALQSVTDLMKMPSLDKAFSMIRMMLGDLNEANADLVNAMQTLQAMLQNLLNNEAFLETLGNLLQNPESSQVYENAMQFLKEASLDDPATHQLLKVVNDSISMLWQEGGADMAVEKLEEVLTALKDNQQATQPLSDSQQALLDLLNKLLTLAQNAVHSGGKTTEVPPTPTTERPADTSTGNDVTVTVTVDRTTATKSPVTTPTPQSSPSLTTSPTPGTTAGPSSTTIDVSGGASTLSPQNTESPDTNDDSGSAHVSVSVLALTLAVLASSL